MFRGAERWWWFVLGALVGWVCGWIVELLYWRRKRTLHSAELEQQLTACQDQVASLQSELAAAKKAPAGVAPTAQARPDGIPAQDLAAIHGIGAVFQIKLYDAGIGTYAELAALGDPAVRAIIQPEEWQEFHYESWNEQARQLAKETGTVGAVWNGVIPDDLSQIEGIGPAAKKKLYAAGVVTFAHLAGKTVAELEAIIQPKPPQKPDLAAWIARAGMRRRAGQ